MKFNFLQNRLNVLTILFLFSLSAIQAQNLERSKTNINLGWNYLENDTKNSSDANAATNWVALNLPYTWNNQDATDDQPGYRRSASWFKKNLTIATIDSNKLYKLYFEGANITTNVYVNGKQDGEHI